MVKKKSRQIIDNTKASTGIASLADQYSHLFVSAFLFLALILRIVALADLKGSIYYDFLLWDERIYHEWARKIADGTFTSTSVYEFPPPPRVYHGTALQVDITGCLLCQGNEYHLRGTDLLAYLSHR